MGSHPLQVTPDPTHTQLWFETQPEGFTRSVCFLCIDQPVGYTAWSQLTLDTTHCLLICRGQKLLEHASQTLLRQNQHSDGHTYMLSLSLEVKMVTCILQDEHQHNVETTHGKLVGHSFHAGSE